MTVRPQLDVLEVSGLIQLATVQPDLAYLFRHALVQEAAYHSLLKHQRRALHLSVGEAIERSAGERTSELAPILARHFDEGEDYGKALKYLVTAGDAATQQFATPESLAHYSRALELAQRVATEPALLCRVWLARGRALEMSGQYREADADYRAMEQYALEHQDKGMELAALVALATVHSVPTALFDPELSRSLSQKALQLALSQNDRAVQAKVYWNMSLTERFTGNFKQAVGYGEKSIAIARADGLREQMAFSLNDMYAALNILGRFSDAQSVFDEALALWKELGNQPMLADSLSNAAQANYIRGKSRQAVSLAADALNICRRVGNIWGQSYALLAGGFAKTELGELGEGLHDLAEADRLGQMAGFAVAVVGGRAIRGMLLMNVGALDRAELLAHEIRAVVEARMPAFRAAPLMLLGGIRRRQGRIAESDELFREAQAGMTNLDSVSGPFIAMEYFEQGLAQGDAQRVLEEATSQLESLKVSQIFLFVPDALCFQAKALRQLGHLGDASATLLEAYAQAAAAESRRALRPILAELVALEVERGNIGEALRWRAEAKEVLDYMLAHTQDVELRSLLMAQWHSQFAIGGEAE